MPSRLFLLSPASCSGNRAHWLQRGVGAPALAQALASPAGAPVGEVFSFISQLYFRGKLTYARRFARVPQDCSRPALGDGVFIITTSRGLLPSDASVTLDTLREFASVDLHPASDRYILPLETATQQIATCLEPGDEVVLLGSIATDKYVTVLASAFGSSLRFPADFVGRGDMSRGGLLLRCVQDNRELRYVPVTGAVRHGVRPPKLERRAATRGDPSLQEGHAATPPTAVESANTRR